MEFSPPHPTNVKIFKNVSGQGAFRWILTYLWHPWAAPGPPGRSSSRRSRNAEERFSLSPPRSSGAAARGPRGLGTSLEGGNQGDHAESSAAAPSLQPPNWHRGGDVLEIIMQRRGYLFPAWCRRVFARLGELLVGKGEEITSLVLISMDVTAQRALGLREDTYPKQTAQQGRGESSSF